MVTLVVPCAGNGSRLGSTEPKSLVKFGKFSLLSTILMRIHEPFNRVILVVRPESHSRFANTLAQELDPRLIAKLDFRFQQDPSGSLDAVVIGVENLQDDVVIVWGDQIGVSLSTVQQVVDSLKDYAFVLPIIEIDQPYVWFEVFQSRIIEVGRSRDGDPIPERGISDVGVFGFSKNALNSLKSTSNHALNENPLRERDLLYIFPEVTLRFATHFIHVNDLRENLAINSPEQLQSALEILGR